MFYARIFLAGAAAVSLSSAAFAQSDTYQCGESRCYDDQADETRRLNLMQLENPDGDSSNDGDSNGDDYGDYDDDSDPNGQGGPYEPVEPDDRYGTPPSDDSYGAPPPDDDDAYDSYPDDGGVDSDDDYQPPPDDDGYPDE